MRYFAYGNLLDIDYMRAICPSARAIGVARLDGFELGFAKCANPAKGGCTLIATPGAATWGVNYELSDEDMTTLDNASGTQAGDWLRKPVNVVDREGRALETTTYLIPAPSGPHAPPASYVAPIFKGAAALDLPPAYVVRLRELVEAAQRAHG